MKKIIFFFTALLFTNHSVAQLGVPDFSFPKNVQFHQLEGDEFVVSHINANKLHFSKLDASFNVLWKDSLQFTNTALNISQSRFTNFLGSNKSILTLGYYPNGQQIVDSTNLYENIVIDFDNETIQNRTIDTILHSFDLQFLPVTDSSIYVFVPRRDVSGFPYYCETRKIDTDANLESVAPYDSMTFSDLPQFNLYRYIDDSIWIIQGITYDAGFSYSMEIDSLKAYQQYPIIDNGSTPTAPNLMYKQFLNDDTLFVMRQFVYADNSRTWILYNYKKDLTVSYYKVNETPKFSTSVFYQRSSTQVLNGKIYVLAYADNSIKQSRIFVYDLNFNPLCEIDLPHTFSNQNSLFTVNHRLYYRFAINNIEYAYYELNSCNQLLGLEEENIDKILNVYPNPSAGIFNINVDAKLVGKTFVITDITGKSIFTGKMNSTNQAINLSALQQGIYLYVIENQQAIRLIKSE